MSTLDSVKKWTTIGAIAATASSVVEGAFDQEWGWGNEYAAMGLWTLAAILFIFFGPKATAHSGRKKD